MKKLLTLFFITLILCSQIQAEIITGEVEYIDEGSNNGITANKQTPDFNYVKKHLFDYENIENLNYLFQGITELKDRKLAKFSDGSYGIQYYDDTMYSWYYSRSGKLINFTLKDTNSYPCKITKYKPDGTVANYGYRLSENESYIYNFQGKLIAHWIGQNCYDENNNLIMNRKIFK